MPARAHRLLIPLAALLAVLPLLFVGPSCGHDFDFHVVSWLEAASQFAHFHYPHWAYTPAWNAGEPRFLFYPPISWTLGALLGLILPWNLVPAAFTFLALTLSGFTARRFVRRYVGPSAATLAAILYLANPYMLFTAYERTAYGELLAASWLPLLFGAALAARVRIPSLAIPIALLWLTNAPAAVMGCYALAFLTLTRLAWPQTQSGAPFMAHSAVSGIEGTRFHLALTTLAGTLLGLALPAFYLLPAAWERKNIQSNMAIVQGMRIADNTLFHHMPPSPDNFAHDVVLHTASIVALTLLAAIAVLAVPAIRRRPLLTPNSNLPKSLLLLTPVIAVLLTPISLPAWAHTPELRFLQFPWRLCALLATVLALVAALAFDRIPRLHILKPIRAAFIPILLALLLTEPAWLVFHQICDIEDAVPARVTLFHSNLGTDPTDEYTPTTADNDVLKQFDPPFWLAPTSSPTDPINAAAPANLPPGPAPNHLTLDVPTPEFLILNLRAFPDWQVLLNARPAPIQIRDDGLIATLLPAGHDTIDVRYHQPPDQTAGLALSAASLLALLALRKHRVLTRFR